MLEKGEPFRVTPADLGTDPNPGWNKSLRVTYELYGLTIIRSWGENSRVEPGSLVPEPLDSPDSDPLVGHWLWNSNQAIFTFKADGATSVAWDSGRWEFLSEKPARTYKLTWKSGSTDIVSLSEDRKSLSGTHERSGGKISAVRVAPN